MSGVLKAYVEWTAVEIQAYCDGWEAHRCGAPATANPYSQELSPKSFLAWQDGWGHAAEARKMAEGKAQMAERAAA